MSEQSIGGLPRTPARLRPDRPFVTCGADRFTFVELDERSDEGERRPSSPR